MEPDFLRDTRASYDAVAVRYAEWLRDELAAKPFDRAILAAFAELVLAAGPGPVADIGCGAGRVTAHLKGLGLTAFGIDLPRRWSRWPGRRTRDCSSRSARCWTLTCRTPRSVACWPGTRPSTSPMTGSRKHLPSSTGSSSRAAMPCWRSRSAMSRVT